MYLVFQNKLKDIFLFLIKRNSVYFTEANKMPVKLCRTNKVELMKHPNYCQDLMFLFSSTSFPLMFISPLFVFLDSQSNQVFLTNRPVQIFYARWSCCGSQTFQVSWALYTPKSCAGESHQHMHGVSGNSRALVQTKQGADGGHLWWGPEEVSWSFRTPRTSLWEMVL